MGVKNTRLSANVYIDFTYIEEFPLLLMVDDAKHFSATQFVEPLATIFVLEIMLTLWAAVYTG